MPVKDSIFNDFLALSTPFLTKFNNLKMIVRKLSNLQR